MDICVEIYVNRMVVSFEGQTVTFNAPFSSVRLLVGDFAQAEFCLRNALKEMNAFGLFRLRKPRLRMYPKERTEGGLSEIEKRILLEVGLGAGAQKVEVFLDGKAI